MSVAQRLVRKLCNDCKKESVIDPKLFPQDFRIPKDLKTHFTAIGCNTCHHTGYQGRKAIYEILPISKELMVPIRDNHLEIDEHIKKNEIKTLKDNALNLIKTGVTSIEEVYSLLTN